MPPEKPTTKENDSRSPAADFGLTLGDLASIGERQQTDSSAKLIGEFGQAFLYGMQAPCQGAMQTLEHATGANLPDLGFVSAPKMAKFGSTDWHVQTAGMGIGSAIPFVAFSLGLNYLSKGVGAKLPIAPTAVSDLAKLAHHTPSIAARAAATGLLYEGLTSHIDPQRPDFWRARFENAAAGATTFGALAAVSGKVLQTGRYLNMRDQFGLGAALRNPIVIGAVSGAVAGPLGAETHSLLSKGHFATKEELTQAAYGNAFMGATMAALHEPFRQKYLDKAEESSLTRKTGSPRERTAEANAIRKEVNRYGDDPTYVMTQALKRDGVRVLAVGEEHLPFDSPLHKTLAEAMPDLRKAGATTLAIELPASAQKYFDEYLRTGSFNIAADDASSLAVMMRGVIEDHGFLQIVKSAHDAGMKVVAIDHPSALTRLPIDRDRFMSEQIMSVLEQPDTKVIYLGGNLHTGRGVSVFGNTMLVNHLRNSLGTPNSPNEGAVVGIQTVFNTETPMNMHEVVASLNTPVAVPIKALRTIPELQAGAHPSLGTNKIGEWDYLFMYPEKRISFKTLARVKATAARLRDILPSELDMVEGFSTKPDAALPGYHSPTGNDFGKMNPAYHSPTGTILEVIAGTSRGDGRGVVVRYSDPTKGPILSGDFNTGSIDPKPSVFPDPKLAARVQRMQKASEYVMRAHDEMDVKGIKSMQPVRLSEVPSPQLAELISEIQKQRIVPEVIDFTNGASDKPTPIIFLSGTMRPSE